MNAPHGRTAPFPFLWILLLALALLLFLAPPPAHAAGPPVLGGTHYPLSGPCRSIAAADFDGDDDTDLAVVDGNSISIWRNTGDGDLEFADRILPGAVAATTADFDRDGHMDLAVLTTALLILRGHGDGTFALPVTYPTGAGPWNVATGELNGDGYPDVVVANFNDSTISVFLSDSHGGLAPSVLYTPGVAPAGVTIADLDGDAFADVAVTTSAGAVAVFRNLGGGALAPRVAYPIGGLPTSLIATDLDGDGARDLAVGTFDGAEVLWNDGTGAFPSSSRYPVSPRRCDYESNIACEDVDGDGVRDLLIPHYSSNNDRVSHLLNRGGRQLHAGADWWFASSDGPYPPDDPLEDGAACVFAADLNRDGRDDVIVTENFRRSPPRMTVLRTLGGGAHGALTVWLPGEVLSVASLGSRGNAPVDLLALRDGGLWRLPGLGDGALMDPVDLGLLSPGSALHSADLNCDGRDDLLASNGDTLWIALCGPDGALGPFEPSLGAVYLCLGDFDADLRPDLVVRVGGRLALRRNDGTGHFAAPVEIPIALPRLSSAVVAGDFNGDGRDDLAVGRNTGGPCPAPCSLPDTIAILINGWDGNFSLAAQVSVDPFTWPGPTWPMREAVSSDLDGDGDQDLVFLLASISVTDGPILVLHNGGSGAFTLVEEHGSIGEDARGLVATDLTGDGRPELAWVSYTGSSIGLLRVLTNDGAGTFAEPSTGRTLPGYPLDLIATDLDADGLPDLVAACRGFYGPGGVLVVPNRTARPTTAVDLTLLEARFEAGAVRLRWHVSGAAPGARVERRADAGAWSVLGDARSDGPGVLRFDDVAVSPGARYGYRLRLTDGAGHTFSPEVIVAVPHADLAIERVQPNPVAGEATVSLRLPAAAPAHLALVDLGGRRVLAHTLERPIAGANVVRLAAPAALRAGVYWLRLTQEGRSATTRIVLVR